MVEPIWSVACLRVLWRGSWPISGLLQIPPIYLPLTAIGASHLRAKPHTPQTNGKAECFIQTALREWAYAQSCELSAQRAQHLPLITCMTLLNNQMGLHS